MQRKSFLSVAISLLLCGSLVHGSPFGRWSAHGRVTNKIFKPSPLTGSTGVEGIYKLELRDKDNKIRRQMVTRVVFLAYQIGDEFNELDPGHPTNNGPKKPARLVTPGGTTRADADEPMAAISAQKVDKNPLLTAHFTQDLLPEIEGF